jgi:hypothetical protein
MVSSKRRYLELHPDLRPYALFMNPRAAKEGGFSNPYIVFPSGTDAHELPRYVLQRMKQVHDNRTRMYELGLTGTQPFDPRFVNGNRWEINSAATAARATDVMKRAARTSKPRLSRKVSARRTLKRSGPFKRWRDHVQHMPGNRAFKDAQNRFQLAQLL